jgi:hypothetical protein
MRIAERAKLVGFAVCAAWLLTQPAVVQARPGGGHTFSSGSSSHSSFSSHSSGSSFHSGSGFGSSTHYGTSGQGDGGELIFWLFRLMFFNPHFGMPLLLVVGYLWWRARRSEPGSWDSSADEEAPAPALVDFTRLREIDPEFSRVVLEDFAYRLYASTQRARHDLRALGSLAPYLSGPVRSELAADGAATAPVSHVVVGALRIDRLELNVPAENGQVSTELSVDYLANLTLGAAGNAQTLYQHEVWVLSRDSTVLSKSPEQTERLGCPNCGAPFDTSDGRRCAYCDQVVVDGRFAWQVVRRSVLERARVPPALTSDVAERGTDLSSVIDPANDATWRALQARDRAVDAANLQARTELIYSHLNTAWTALDLSSVRGLVSDGMFDYLRYWTEAYAQQGLRNMLENMRVQRMERVKVVLDKHFDAVTLRLWATGLDYTVNAKSGAVVSGSKSSPRAYSEYWTLIRSASAHGPASAEATCPSCAAPLQVSMAGNCQHCGTHVTRGEFDWVLSKIEQDDVYQG